MKRIKSQCSDGSLAEALYLRYGTRSPTRDTPPLLPLKQIAEALDVEEATLTGKIRRYFEALPRSANKDGGIHDPFVRRSRRRQRLKELATKTRVTERNIRDEELEFIIGQESLRKLSPYSLPERVQLFSQRFPDREIKPWTLRAIMLKAGIRKKTVITRNAPARAEERVQEF